MHAMFEHCLKEALITKDEEVRIPLKKKISIGGSFNRKITTNYKHHNDSIEEIKEEMDEGESTFSQRSGTYRESDATVTK